MRLYEAALAGAKSGSMKPIEVSKDLEKASLLGSSDATYALATWYLHGTFFKKNIATGTRLLKMASEAGIAHACYDLAYSFEAGIGVKQNLPKAFQLYMEAAMRGDASANTDVARCLWHGIGTRKNRTLADLWGAKGKK